MKSRTQQNNQISGRLFCSRMSRTGRICTEYRLLFGTSELVGSSSVWTMHSNIVREALTIIVKKCVILAIITQIFRSEFYHAWGWIDLSNTIGFRSSFRLGKQDEWADLEDFLIFVIARPIDRKALRSSIWRSHHFSIRIYEARAQIPHLIDTSSEEARSGRMSAHTVVRTRILAKVGRDARFYAPDIAHTKPFASMTFYLASRQ